MGLTQKSLLEQATPARAYSDRGCSLYKMTFESPSSGVYLIFQRYKFKSKSQQNMSKGYFDVGCFRYVKDTNQKSPS